MLHTGALCSAVLRMPILTPLLRLSMRREARLDQTDTLTCIEHRPSAISIVVDHNGSLALICFGAWKLALLLASVVAVP